MASKGRANGEGSIYPFRNGFAAYVWVTTPSGERKRKYVYGPTREVVHEKWLKLHQAAKNGPVVTSVPRLSEFLNYWLTEVIKPNRAPLTYVNYELFTRLYINPMLGGERLDKLGCATCRSGSTPFPGSVSAVPRARMPAGTRSGAGAAR